MNEKPKDIAFVVKQLRKEAGISQIQLAEFSGVGLALVRKIEQGGSTMRVDKVNKILALFDYKLKAMPVEEIGPVSTNNQELPSQK